VWRARDWGEKRWYLVVGGLKEVGAAKGIGQGGARLVRTPAARTPGQGGSPLIDVHLTCTRQNEDFVKISKETRRRTYQFEARLLEGIG
jgi:hypothetical protein